MTLHRFLPVLLCVLLSGCSYSFKGQIAGDIRSIAVPNFENETTEFGLGEKLTEELIRGFQRDGTLRVYNEEQADAILVGRIMRVDDQPYSARPGATITVEEYRFSMSCEIDLIDPETQEPIWTQTFPAWAVYPYTGSLENRDAAIEEATGKLMEDILNKIVGGW